jgi:hypothetical protein
VREFAVDINAVECTFSLQVLVITGYRTMI